ncbi:hypothetical protein [Dyadobacter sp. LHD-138]|nr:hypothetical protein [Dyadobacter sp. LHD-138]MDQ6480332.1 hypothetical protein [Dyadobacter sp. LHD-138]
MGRRSKANILPKNLQISLNKNVPLGRLVGSYDFVWVYWLRSIGTFRVNI